jgi:hypothetical protein
VPTKPAPRRLRTGNGLRTFALYSVLFLLAFGLTLAFVLPGSSTVIRSVPLSSMPQIRSWVTPDPVVAESQLRAPGQEGVPAQALISPAQSRIQEPALDPNLTTPVYEARAAYARTRSLAEAAEAGATPATRRAAVQALRDLAVNNGDPQGQIRELIRLSTVDDDDGVASYARSVYEELGRPNATR